MYEIKTGMMYHCVEKGILNFVYTKFLHIWRRGT